jgi:phthiodiolone/phenolphthiodiolone dimycocerosates ketoreductase
MLRLTGQYADGWLPAMVTSPEEYRAMLEVIRAAAQEAGRDPQAITSALYQFTMLAPTEHEVQAMLETKLGRWLSGLVLASAEEWRKLGVAHPFGENYRGYIDTIPEQYDRPTLEQALAAVPPKLLGYGLLWGTPEQVAGKLRAFGEAGLRHVVLFPWSMILSRQAAIEGLRAIRIVARMLRSGQ